MEIDADVRTLLVHHPDVAEKLLISLASRLENKTTELYGIVSK